MATFHDGQGLVFGKREKQWAIPNPVVNRFPDPEIKHSSRFIRKIHGIEGWPRFFNPSAISLILKEIQGREASTGRPCLSQQLFTIPVSGTIGRHDAVSFIITKVFLCQAHLKTLNTQRS
jgi:hypothetical protein